MIMDYSEKLNLLQQWEKVIIDFELKMNSLNKLFSVAPESEFCYAMEILSESYTKTLAKLLGDNDEMLLWFWLENDMGRGGLTAKKSSWKKPKKIETIDNLLDFIN